MSASHDSTSTSSDSGTSVVSNNDPNGLQQISPLGSTDQNWLGQLQRLGYTPSSGSWQMGSGGSGGAVATPVIGNPSGGFSGFTGSTVGNAVATPSTGGLPSSLTSGANEGILRRLIMGKS